MSKAMLSPPTVVFVLFLKGKGTEKNFRAKLRFASLYRDII
jgi:hypothetical protein